MPILEYVIQNSKRNPISCCLEWQGALNQDGYGRIMFNGRRTLTHRVAYELFTGPIPVGKQVLHHCDNGKCIEVQHLYLGTDKENSRDRRVRGRAHKPIGEKHPNAKLKNSDVLEIRSGKYKHMRHWQIAKIYGIATNTVETIINNRSWKKVLKEAEGEI